MTTLTAEPAANPVSVSDLLRHVADCLEQRGFANDLLMVVHDKGEVRVHFRHGFDFLAAFSGQAGTMRRDRGEVEYRVVCDGVTFCGSKWVGVQDHEECWREVTL